MVYIVTTELLKGYLTVWGPPSLLSNGYRGSFPRG